MNTCIVDGCDKKSKNPKSPAPCAMHYKRWRLYGSYDEQPRIAHNRSNEEDFWTKLKATKSGCLEHPGSPDEWGYAQLSYQGKRWRAHRLSFYLTHGYTPEPPLMILHHCDNPPCCNSDHLYAGTGSDNMNDMYGRKRGNRATGYNHHMVKYTAEDAILIKESYRLARQDAKNRGLTRVGKGKVNEIAQNFNVSVDTVRRICSE